MGRIYLSPPHVGPRERELLLDAFDSGWIAPTGPHVDAFEREVAQRVGVAHGAALSSGTAALHLALMHLGVGPGDRVLVPTLTFVATANAVCYLGAEPVFIDSERQTWNMDPERVRQALEQGEREGRMPKVVLTVDLYGQCADYDALLPLCESFGVPVLEDAAEALGATWQGRAAGAFGVASVLSFNGNKICTTSGGGMLLSNDEHMIARARHLATQAREPAPHYEHVEVGYNYRLSNVLAALGRGQLETLDERMESRRETFGFYEALCQEIDGIEMMPTDSRGEPNHWLSCVLVDEERFQCNREALRLHLETLDIEARPTWKPMHLQPVFEGSETFGGAVAEELFSSGLCLPSGSQMGPAERERVAAGIHSRPRGGP